jgi:EpsI family protein
MKTTRYTILIIIIVVLGIYTFAMRYREIEQPPVPNLHLLPETIGGYRGSDNFLEPASLSVLGADGTLFRTFIKEGSPPIWLFLGYFGAQQEHSQIHSPKNCYPGSGWNILQEGTITVTIPDGKIKAKQLIISDGAQSRIVIYWFSTPTGPVRDEFALKWYQAKRSLSGKPQVSTFVRFSTIVRDEIGMDATRSMTMEFIEMAAPLIEMALSEREGDPAR